jgi:type IV pilus assembly protein PilV
MNRPIKNISKIKNTQQGVVLLEALIAVLLFSMGVLALVGLQAAMMKNTEDSKIRSDASYLVQQRLGQMWADPANLANYVETAADISSMLPQGTRTVAVAGVNPAQVTVTINWQQPGKDPHHFTTIATISP